MAGASILAAFLLVPPAVAGDSVPDRSGHYYLQGVMETGSELLLRPDGRFQWYLVVGALDLFAEGRWTSRDDAVLLASEKSADVPDPAFETLILRVRDGALIPPDGRGSYVAVAVAD